MAYIQVEASVRTHRKFLQAGPAASWLWLCGMGYCQDGLTDGFIPYEAIDYLGVTSSTARKLKCKLVEVGLWEEVKGGWKVHDYLFHNRSAHEIRTTKDRRRAGGALGGRPQKETSDETLEVSGKVNLPANHTENPSHLNGGTATPERQQTALPRRRLDAAYQHEGGLYVPQTLHDQWLQLHPDVSEQQFFDFYGAVCLSWRGRNTGADMFKFWKARHDERWPPEQSKKAATPWEPLSVTLARTAAKS
jgi:hypothetical protein